jgi:hypothetical protein
MPIIVELISQPQQPPGGATDLVVRAGLPKVDGCPVVLRTKGFLVEQGTDTTIEHVVRDRNGRPFDLSAYATSSSGSDSGSSSSPTPSALVRIREPLSSRSARATLQLEVDIVDPAAGTVRVDLPAAALGTAGIFQMAFGFLPAGAVSPNLTDHALLSIEKSLWGPLDQNPNAGPPTLREIRLDLWDADRRENLRIDTVEFSDEQIIQAIIDPIRQWNETPPPIAAYTTARFPYHLAWRNAVVGRLLQNAAHHYRRNRQKVEGGGLQDDDLNREPEYAAAGKARLDEWDLFIRTKKAELNFAAGWGTVHSDYAFLWPI